MYARRYNLPQLELQHAASYPHAAAQLSCLVFLLLLREFPSPVSASLAAPPGRTSHKAGIE